MGVVGTLATLMAGYGFICFLQLSVWYWIIFGPIVLLWFIIQFTRNFLRIWYKNFSKTKHLTFVNNFWKIHKEPSVAVFLPWCGESLDVYRQTLEGVSGLKYKNIKVYLLDDKGDLKVEELAKEFGFKYLCRENKGEYRKSGNLQYAWSQTKEEFAFILDADFVPVPDALWHTMPYIISNPSMGILQTPQYFEQTKEKHDESAIEFGGGNVVEEFYNIDQTSRDRFDAAICVGTSAIYRRAAIESVGGTPKVWGTEDVRTGLSITRGGYKVKYIPLIVSIGTSPNTLQDYFRQHNRWCTGSIQILLDYLVKAKLSWFGKLIYLLNPLYYVSEALSVILVFHFVALIAFQPNTIALYNSLLFIPKLLLELLLIPYVFRNHKPRLGSRLAAMNNVFTYFYTIFFDMFSKTKLLWHPAGVTIGGISREFRATMRIGIFMTSLYVGALTVVLAWRRDYLLNPQISIVVVWALYVAVWNLIYIYHATHYLRSHDISFTHPTSKVQTHTRRVWAHIKHTILPILTLILFVTLSINVYQMAMAQRSFVKNNVSKPTVETTPKLTPTPTGDNSVYEITVEKGEGVTQIARKALHKYLDDMAIYLDKGQVTYAEDDLRHQLGSSQKISAGTVVKVSKDEIKSSVDKTLAKSESIRAKKSL